MQVRQTAMTIRHTGIVDSIAQFVGIDRLVAQTAWIQNATVRDSILFGKPFDAGAPHVYRGLSHTAIVEGPLAIHLRRLGAAHRSCAIER
jgi:hypothetical protein